jgi:glyoxylate reductase
MSRPQVLVTRRIPQVGISLLEQDADIDVYEKDGPMQREELLRRIRGKDGILCMLSDRLDKEALDNADRLKVISTYAVGYNNIDVVEATKRGIIVTNTPGVLREATADLAWSLLMAAARKIPQSDRFVREGKFNGWGPELFLGHDVHGKTIGIVGMGDIGLAMARRARGFGMKILYHNLHPSPHATEVEAELVPLEHLLRRSDFITLHVPATPATRHLIGKDQISMMKTTAILVNASRGEVVDEAALVLALKEKRIAAAGLDVYEKEPALSPGLAELDNVVLTPHTGSGTYGTRDHMAVMAATNLLAVLMGEAPPNPVHPK